MSFVIEGATEVADGLWAVAQEMLRDIEGAGEEIAVLLEGYAKEHHPWQNRTGELEASISADVESFTGAVLTVALSAGTDYAQFLELARDGRWAWLWPAMLACVGGIEEILTRRLACSILEGVCYVERTEPGNLCAFDGR